MSYKPFRVGIVGLQPDRSWAARAHIPALRALSDRFEITGVANTSRASAERAASELGLPRAFDGLDDMVSDPGIDIVVVTVRVPHHLNVVRAAVEAGKHVYCEWPLGNGLAEAQMLTELADRKGVVGVIGTQARVAPEVQHLRDLVAGGYVGEVLSTTVLAHGGGWGGVIPEKRNSAYLLDVANGATMLTIPVGHMLSAVDEVLGSIDSLSSVLATRRPMAVVADSGEVLPVSAPDQVLVSGILRRDVPIAMHYRGGMARDGRGLSWEINGTKGDLRLSGPFGHPQLVPLSIEGAAGDEKEFRPIEVPHGLRDGFPADPVIGNVARIWSRLSDDLRNGGRTAPRFEDGVAIHRTIAAVDTAHQSSRSVS